MERGGRFSQMLKVWLVLVKSWENAVNVNLGVLILGVSYVFLRGLKFRQR